MMTSFRPSRERQRPDLHPSASVANAPGSDASRALRVVYRPAFRDFLGNRKFLPINAYAVPWMLPFIRLRERAAERGIQIDTWDMHPPACADAIIIEDLPATRGELDALLAEAPNAARVLFLLETPLGKPHFFRRENHADFDIVLTYNPHLVGDRYRRYFIPLGRPGTLPDPPFAERRPLALINSNRYLQPFGMTTARMNVGWGRLPGIGWFLSGWRFTVPDFLGIVANELYTRRRQLARLAETRYPGVLDLYGPGWSGEHLSWYNRLVPNRPFRDVKGRATPKFDVLPGYRFSIAFENATGNVGYISEKIFDALLAGVVPIYLGESRIADYVDPACYVDARRFRSDHELLEYARDCPEAEWSRLRAAGRAYLQSPAFDKFLPDAFSDTMLAAIDAAVAKRKQR